MQDIMKIYALVDRKVSNFNFSLNKITGNLGNEYYVVSVECMVKDEVFVEKAISVGCPQNAIVEIEKNLLAFVEKAEKGKEVVKGIRLTKATKEIAKGITHVGEIQDDEEYDDDDYCGCCGELLDECTCDDECDCEECVGEVAVGITLKPAVEEGIKLVPHTGTEVVYKFCPVCGKKLETSFAFCNTCGTKQP